MQWWRVVVDRRCVCVCVYCCVAARVWWCVRGVGGGGGGVCVSVRVCARLCGCGDVWRRVCGGACVAAAVAAVCVCVVCVCAPPMDRALECERDRVGRIAELVVAAVMVAVVVVAACVCVARVCVCVCALPLIEPVKASAIVLDA